MTTTPNRRPTMRDVAERAGVSFKTVSRVVNGEPGVSGDLMERVEEAVTMLGYRPDERARHLRQTGSQTGAIGFVMVDVANPFFSSILRGIEEVARKRHYLVLAGSTDGDVDREEQLVEAFVARRVDGFIVVPSAEIIGSLVAEIERGTPVVVLDVELPGRPIDLVRSDHHGGALTATQHLLSRGHRDIAYFGDEPTVFSARLRLSGFREAMGRVGSQPSADRVTVGRHTPIEWRHLITAYLRQHDPPTAIFTAQNFATVGAAQALHDLGLHHSIAQIGFDDIELADIVDPGISVVPQQPWDLGRRAAEMLFRRLDGATNPPTREVIGSPVIARGSGEIAPNR